jgi:hypothetical protein
MLCQYELPPELHRSNAQRSSPERMELHPSRALYPSVAPSGQVTNSKCADRSFIVSQCISHVELKSGPDMQGLRSLSANHHVF